MSSTWRSASRARLHPARRSMPSSARSTARRSGYTVALGLPALRARIAGHYRQRYGLEVAPERVVVTTGSSAGFVLAFLALFDAGAKVALPSPGYPCYRHILTALGQALGAAHDRCGLALDADRAPDRRRRDAGGPGRPRHRQPRQSDRHHAGGEPVGRDRRGVPAPRHLAGLRRDLPRPHLRDAGGDGAGASARTRSWSTASPSTSP